MYQDTRSGWFDSMNSKEQYSNNFNVPPEIQKNELGKWLKQATDTFKCDKCGLKYYADDRKELNYCPCCGDKKDVRLLGL